MFEYLIANVCYVGHFYIIAENSYKGFKINVSRPDYFEVDKVQRIYIHTKIQQTLKSNFSFEYYGFSSLSEKILFEQLLTVPGIGTKSAILMMKSNIKLIKDLIVKKDFKSLSVLEGFNIKSANNVINCLSEKLSTVKEIKNNETIFDGKISDSIEKLSQLVSALKALGYKKHDIEKAVNLMEADIENVNEIEVSDLISKAIQVISANENCSN